MSCGRLTHEFRDVGTQIKRRNASCLAQPPDQLYRWRSLAFDNQTQVRARASSGAGKPYLRSVPRSVFG